jgi:glycosyltransferase involved in cell wall biosynthesis
MFTPLKTFLHIGCGPAGPGPKASAGIGQYRSCGFDPEFASGDPGGGACRTRIKNVNNLVNFETADAGLSPTQWQASPFPERFRKKITVVHDGIDTKQLIPRPDAGMTLNHRIQITKKDPVITFVNRNLEPYRGYHVFMRALPDLLARNPGARVLIIGGIGVSYCHRAL